MIGQLGVTNVVPALIAQEDSSGSFNLNTIWLVYGVLIVGSGVIGAAIGSTKGRGTAGFWLGAVLGFVGWIITALLSRTPEKEAERLQQIAAHSEQLSTGAGQGPGAGPLEGSWAPDPFQRHSHRWFDGNSWTDRVADNGQVSTDSPTHLPPAGSGWAADPYERFPQRYHDGDRWTEHVTRNGQTFKDPAVYPSPPAAPPHDGPGSSRALDA